MITIAHTVVLRINRLAERGDNPLGISLKGDDGLPEARDTLEKALLGVDAATAAAVATSIAVRLSNTRTIGNPRGGMPVDTLIAALMAHRGIDPLVATWTALEIGVLALDDTTTGLQAASIDGTTPCLPSIASLTEVTLGEHVWQQRGRLLTTARIPHTIQGHCQGRQLRDVVSHPVLDQWDLPIEKIREHDSHTALNVTQRMRAATVEDLVSAMTRG